MEAANTGTLQNHAGTCAAFLLTLTFHVITLAANPEGQNDAGAATRACSSAARETQRINLSSGVYTERAVAAAPLYIELPRGQDERLFDECMQRSGFSPREQVRAEFERVEACNDPARRRVVLKRNGTAAPTIGDRFDSGAYARCIAGAIEVEVELDSGTK